MFCVAMSQLKITQSSRGYAETVDALLASIDARGLTVFARIDHAAGARSVGLELEDEEVVVFGSPKSGTPLMQSDPSVGIELPLRVLLWQAGAEVKLAYHDPHELAGSYAVAEHRPILDQMAGLMEALVSEAAGAA
jgi:uncharacterized protein (DUF302 family)